MCGIKPAEIGFEKVNITPHPGELKQIQASIPHPKGRIEVDYKVKNGQIKGTVTLPEGLSGEWNYDGETVALASGENKIR